MHTVQTRELELMPARHRDDSANVVRAAWPVHRGSIRGFALFTTAVPRTPPTTPRSSPSTAAPTP